MSLLRDEPALSDSSLFLSHFVLQTAARDAFRKRQHILQGPRGVVKSLTDLKCSRRASKAISSICREVERECPVLKYAYSSWAAKAVVRNYHKNAREHSKKLANETLPANETHERYDTNDTSDMHATS